MKITKIGETFSGQDGAIYNGKLFRFDSIGNCRIYNVDDFTKIASAKLKGDIIPHCNAVFFGSEFFDEIDEFPALYANIYNNYAKYQDKLKGTCLVYRIILNDNEYSLNLKQVIKIGFCEDELWCSKNGDIRPYGNFAYDSVYNRYYAFNMMDELKITRYFAFNMPKLSDGFEVVLNKEDIIEYFDCPYHNYVQGAVMHEGKIYSVEGFSNNIYAPTAIRIIDTTLKKQVSVEYFKN